MKEPSRPDPAGEIGPIVREREELIRQRDKLVEALQNAVADIRLWLEATSPYQYDPRASEQVIQQAEALLAEVRGGK